MAFMSAWYMIDTATVYPRLASDDWGGGVTYGTPYLILCGHEGVSRQSRDTEGAEFVTRDIYYTGDTRPAYLDRIAYGDTTAQAWDAVSAAEIRKIARHGMSAFGYEDEYELETV
jgi:hypothetical protein